MMKHAVFGIAILFALVGGVVFTTGFAFAQPSDINEQTKLSELQAIIVQLLQLVAELQKQLLAVQQSRVAPVASACGQAEVVWEKVSGATGYALYRNSLEVYSGKNTKFVDTGLAPGATYAYMVRAENAGGLSPASPVKAITLHSQCPPPPPAVWVSEGVCGGNAQIFWSQTQGADFYEVFRGNALASSGTGFSFLDRGLSPGKIYVYKVRAGNAGGLGEFSPERSARASLVCPPTAPAQPQVGTPFLEDVAREGVFSLAMQKSPSKATAQSGRAGVNILSFRASAARSPISLSRMDVEFSDRPWLFLKSVEILDGRRVALRVEVSEDSFVRGEGDKYRLSLPGLGIEIPEGKNKVISVRASAKEGLSQAVFKELTISIPANGVQARDQIGIVHPGPPQEDTSVFGRIFFVKGP